ncbi:glucosamine-6-phosphate deaminase [Mycolicibacterium sarraceniae]|uniref:Glucosamine-6-phosphate deaminase n=1 Tax=Mycolicibacterium sarraceniae TaxID=1534348 RepID=A0A7I7SPK9_9MYCO|nr:glucosamine-6-phosphate deaminase [Mycolicibacterium sarraceniae]BBY58311.1 glucosamine-6-phosphate deaminase [Mycolicibacterium sarraceniae]
MKIIIVADPVAAAAAAADIVTSLVARKPNAVLGVATGTSPQGLYAELAARVQTGLEMSAVTVFALDEYVGLAASDPRSYTYFIHTIVAQPLRLDPERVHVPIGVGDDLDSRCRQYEAAIAAAGGVDLQILGIGRNGHLGFNEPTSSLVSRTRVAPLARSTRQDNARFFGVPADVPVRCVTQGLGTIMEARVALLIATGAAKAPAIARAVEGPVSAFCPASILQQHRDAVVILDEAAAGELTLAEEYREAARVMAIN